MDSPGSHERPGATCGTYEIYDRLLVLVPLDWRDRLKYEAKAEVKKMDHDHLLSHQPNSCLTRNDYHSGYGPVTITHTEMDLPFV